MTRRRGKEASERRSGIGKTRGSRWRRSNLMKLVAFRKGNHPGEAYVRTGRRKALYRRERDSLEELHEQAEIQRKALRRGKNVAFSEDTCLEKKRVRSKVTPRKDYGRIWRQMNNVALM